MKGAAHAVAGCITAVCLAAPARAADAMSQAHYAGYAHGLNVFDVDAALSVAPAAYRLRLSFRLTGVLGAVIHADGSTVVDGRFDGARAIPRELFSTGQFRGIPHVTQIDWANDLPIVKQMSPAADPDREQVADAERVHTIDPLSGIAVLLRQVNQTGSCDAAAQTFDGARLSKFAAHTAGEDVLEPTDRSSFAGQALRCDVTGQMIGGFMRDSDQTELRKPKQGRAWFARLRPGEPMIPVRIVFYSDGAPSATLYLMQPPSGLGTAATPP